MSQCIVRVIIYDNKYSTRQRMGEASAAAVRPRRTGGGGGGEERAAAFQ